METIEAPASPRHIALAMEAKTVNYAGVAHGQRLRVTVGLFIAPHSWGLAVQSTHPFGSPCNVHLIVPS